jgi:hypothetical protein
MDPATLQNIVFPALTLVAGTTIGLLTTWFWRARDHEKTRIATAAAERAAMQAELTEMKSRLAVMGASMTTVSALFQKIIITELTHLSTPELDALLVKLGPPNILTAADETRMMALLKERADDPNPSISGTERDDCRMLPAIIKRVRAELVANNNASLIIALPATGDVQATVVSSQGKFSGNLSKNEGAAT